MSLRLLITGKTRSGKSTTLHTFIAATLKNPIWQKIILLDGKGVELSPYLKLQQGHLRHNLAYFGPSQLEAWATVLTNIANDLENRYATLIDKGLRLAPADQPRYLIIADEVQVGCRDAKYGRVIKQALTHLCEQSAALGDTIVMTCQRAENSVPPNVRWNCNGRLAMLGNGFFHYKPDGLTAVAGKLPYVSPEQAFQKLNGQLTEYSQSIDAANLLTLLGADRSDRTLDPARANATLYLGSDGSGKTHALKVHKTGRTKRTVYADLQEPLRTWLTSIMGQCNGSIPSKTTNVEAAELVELALRAEPSALLLDNLDKATERARPILQRLINSADIVAISARPPETPAQERKLNPFIPRCKIIRLSPLSANQSSKLADATLPADIPRRNATIRRITDMSAGHPATIVNLCLQAKTGSLKELRHLEHTPRMFNLAWLLLLPLLIFIIVWRYRVDSYLLSAFAIIGLMLLRPIVYSLVRKTWNA